MPKKCSIDSTILNMKARVSGSRCLIERFVCQLPENDD